MARYLKDLAVVAWLIETGDLVLTALRVLMGEN